MSKPVRLELGVIKDAELAADRDDEDEKLMDSARVGGANIHEYDEQILFTSEP